MATTGESATAAGLTLPPNVVGKVNGHLVMKVDEVLWARKPPGDVSAVVMWWGGEEPTTFRPTDVAQDALQRKNAGVIYEIRTSMDLFEKYLRKCGSLEIAIADKYGMPIGCASVPNLWQMSSKSPYQGYYPIVNNFGNRIGDLHVSFNLRMLTNAENGTVTVPKLPNKVGVKTKYLKRLSPSSSRPSPVYPKTKEEKTIRNEKVLKDVVLDNPINENPYKTVLGAENPDSVQKRLSPTSNIISQILENGTRLRDAMTASVMADELELDLKDIPGFKVLPSVSEVPSEKVHQVGTARYSSASNASPATTASQKPCEESINLLVERKIQDYLSGKPMSASEEKEALNALRSITPTKDIMDSVIPDAYQQRKSEETNKLVSKESSEVVTNITDYVESSSHVSSSKIHFDVDSQILSKVNCLRVTVSSLLLNTVGIKRVGTFLNKKSSLSRSNTSIHPPGVTYFVEYKFPLASGSRPWESSVRYCSKRIHGLEIVFGDRTVHNLPPTWHSSISEETDVGSLISSLSFKVCARHLHQRVSIPLGIGTPESAQDLIRSTNLRHEYDLSVISSDHLPVAQLRICLELGRDRIHFGGLFDPDNNSLGIVSPRKTTSALSKDSSSKLVKKRGGRSVTVTRNVASKSPGMHKVPLQQATRAGRVIQQLMSQANDVNSAHSGESSSAPSTGRSYPSKSSIHAPLKNEALTSNFKTKLIHEKPIEYASHSQFLKHEVAITILQVIGKNYLTYSTADDKGFYVSYKFPTLNAQKNYSVSWHSYSTEPSECVDGIWEKPQNRIHTLILSKNEACCDFLQHVFILQDPKKKCVVFSLCVRCYGAEVQDLPVAEAILPLTCLSTLESAYKEAKKSDPNFSSSSCSTIVLDLPFELLPSYQSQSEKQEEHGCLRLKVDYRHSAVEQLSHCANLPRSRGDSVTESIPHYKFGDSKHFGEKLKFKLACDGEMNEGKLLNSPDFIPNWAKSPDKLFPQSLKAQNKRVNPELHQATGLNEPTNSAARNLHAAWEPVQDKNPRSSVNIVQESAYLPNTSNVPADYKSIADVIDETKGFDSFEHQRTDNLNHIHSHHVSSQSLKVESPCSSLRNVQRTDLGKEEGKIDVATSTSPLVSHWHTSTRGTSPPLHSKLIQNEIYLQDRSTSMEKIPDKQDSSQQVSIQSVSQGSQTTPRESKHILTKNIVEISTNFDMSLQDSENEIPAGSLSHCETSNVAPVHQEDQSIQSSHCALNEDSESSQKLSLAERTDAVSSPRVSTVFLPSFHAKIAVECALHLKPVVDKSTESYVFVSLSTCGLDGSVSANMGMSPVSMSPAVICSSEPEWNWLTEVKLPADLLVSALKRLIFKVWQCDEKPAADCVQANLGPTNLIGFSALDLTVLSAGLPFISGWYNIMDFTGRCRGQIKISVKPLEDISKIINLSSLTCTYENPSNPPASMFLAHCAYSEFPSHVTQFPDMRVQKVDPRAPSETISAILSDYNVVSKHCQRLRSAVSMDLHHQSSRDIDGNLSISLQKKDESPALEMPPSNGRGDEQSEQTSAPGSTVALVKDPSILLREKLSELDMVTKGIQQRLLTRGGCTDSSRSPTAPVELPATDRFISESHEPQQPTYVDSINQCGTCASHSKSVLTGNDLENSCLQGKQGAGNECQFNLGISTACGDEFLCSVSRDEGKKSYHKQRKTWEKQEDLIDFGNLHIDCKGDEQPFQNEDLSDWLSESALQQVFNPFLFNNILNSMSSSRGVQVIELDNSNTSDDDMNSQVATSCQTEGNLTKEEGKGVPTKNRRRSRRGDETYRKEIPNFVSNVPQSTRRTGLSAGDADSGVDVDVSANFHSGGLSELFHPHTNMPGVRTASSEREESSSCSLSSRNRQSTLPSSASASATPSESPQHPLPHSQGCPHEKSEVVMGKHDSAGHVSNNHSQRRNM